KHVSKVTREPKIEQLHVHVQINANVRTEMAAPNIKVSTNN
ncbi:44236_t:CDS:1, partial [Gigaspora margarita]